MKRKKAFTEGMQRIVREYRAAGQPWPASSSAIARWAIRNKKWGFDEELALRACARDIARAMREEYYTDPQGRRVRLNHAAKLGKDQETLWGDIMTSSPEFMGIAFAQRRLQIVGDCKQLKADVDSYNDNNPHGAEVETLWDFTNEVEPTSSYDPVEIDPDLAAIVSEPQAGRSRSAS